MNLFPTGGPMLYERLVERLLASPHYGEKWARQWLNAAVRGTPTVKDKPRSIWPYRDLGYVIARRIAICRLTSL